MVCMFSRVTFDLFSWFQSRLADLIHHMGGSIRKDFSFRITHLVANCTSGEKFRVRPSRERYIIFSNIEQHVFLNHVLCAI